MTAIGGDEATVAVCVVGAGSDGHDSLSSPLPQ